MQTYTNLLMFYREYPISVGCNSKHTLVYAVSAYKFLKQFHPHTPLDRRTVNSATFICSSHKLFSLKSMILAPYSLSSYGRKVASSKHLNQKKPIYIYFDAHHNSAIIRALSVFMRLQGHNSRLRLTLLSNTSLSCIAHFVIPLISL